MWLLTPKRYHCIESFGKDYYEVINTPNDMGESTPFIEFMLSTIKASLIEAIKTSDEMSDGMINRLTNKDSLRWKKIKSFLEKNEFIMNSDIRYLFAVSPATANRILAELVKKEKPRKIQKSGHWAYELNPDFFRMK